MTICIYVLTFLDEHKLFQTEQNYCDIVFVTLSSLVYIKGKYCLG